MRIARAVDGMYIQNYDHHVHRDLYMTGGRSSAGTTTAAFGTARSQLTDGHSTTSPDPNQR
jgi:hypothetical protein